MVLLNYYAFPNIYSNVTLVCSMRRTRFFTGTSWYSPRSMRVNFRCLILLLGTAWLSKYVTCCFFFSLTFRTKSLSDSFNFFRWSFKGAFPEGRFITHLSRDLHNFSRTFILFKDCPTMKTVSCLILETDFQDSKYSLFLQVNSPFWERSLWQVLVPEISCWYLS